MEKHWDVEIDREVARWREIGSQRAKRSQGMQFTYVEQPSGVAANLPAEMSLHQDILG